MNFDTYEFIERLKDAGFAERQAKALTDGLKQIELFHVATKEDLDQVSGELKAENQELRQEIRIEFQQVREEIQLLRQETRNDFQELRQETRNDSQELRQETKKDIQQLKDHINDRFHTFLMWVIPIILGQIVTFAGIVKLFRL